MPKSATVTLTLEGRHDEIMEYVNMMLGDGIVKSMQFIDAGNGAAKAPRAKSAPTSFAAGDRVVVQATARTLYGVTKGDAGRVTAVKNSGHGRLVTVKWDGDGESDVAASLLAKVRK